LSQKLALVVMALGPVTKCLNLTHLWYHPQKKTKSKAFQFLKIQLEDSPLLLRVWTAL